MKTIPFTQYLRPDGRRRPCEFEIAEDNTPGLERLAERFIAAGGGYEAEVLRTGEVSLTAVFKLEGELQDIAIEVVPNGHRVVPAVDLLVRRSVEWLEAREARE